MKHKLLSLLFALALCMGLLCVTASAETTVSTWSGLQDAMNGGGEIKLAYDITAESSDAFLTVPFGIAVTLDLNGHTIDRGLTAPKDNGYVIFVRGALTLTDSAEGGTITGGNNSGSGGGVYVYGGTFTMTGGSITKNTASESGGGVYVVSNAVLTLSGGSITDNEASYGGGAFAALNTTLILSCGGISGNTATVSGGGVYASLDSKVTLSDGSISENTARNYGGGVYLDSSTFTMNGSAEVAGNTAASGGGIWIASDGAFTMQSGTIANNIARNTQILVHGGGGVYVNGGTFTMNGGVIRENEAVQAGSGLTHGGGVYVYDGTLDLSGGGITDNSANDNGGGVYFAGNSIFRVSGSPGISGNKAGEADNNVYLLSGKTITVSGVLSSGGAGIGVTTQVVPTQGEPTAITDTTSGAQIFQSDDVRYNAFDDGVQVRLYWNPVVTYLANGGTGTMAPQIVPYGTGTTVSGNSFIRSGWSFAGWNTNADGTGTPYSADGSITLTSDLTLYAQWVEKSKLTFAVIVSGTTYGQTLVVCVSDNPGGGAVSYAYKPKGTDDSAYVPLDPNNPPVLLVGDYTMRAAISESQNYLAGTATADFTITAATLPAEATVQGWVIAAWYAESGRMLAASMTPCTFVQGQEAEYSVPRPAGVGSDAYGRVFLVNADFAPLRDSVPIA